MQGEVQPALETQRVQQSMRDVLCEVQMRSAGDLRQPRTVWALLHRDDHPRQQAQVPLITTPPVVSVYSYICKDDGALLNK